MWCEGWVAVGVELGDEAGPAGGEVPGAVEEKESWLTGGGRMSSWGTSPVWAA